MAKVSSFEAPSVATLGELANAVSRAMYDLYNVLRNLSFSDNFKAYIWEGEIAAGAEAEIRHNLDRVPTGYFTIKKTGGDLVDGSVWTSTHVSVLNTGASPETFKVIFFI